MIYDQQNENLQNQKIYLCCNKCNFDIAKQDDIIKEKYEQILLQKVYAYQLDVIGFEAYCYSSTNPNDNRYDVLRLKDSAKIVSYGEYNAECSWFPPFQWKYCICPKCFYFLGWKFQNNNDIFYGIIITNCKEIWQTENELDQTINVEMVQNLINQQILKKMNEQQQNNENIQNGYINDQELDQELDQEIEQELNQELQQEYQQYQELDQELDQEIQQELVQELDQELDQELQQELYLEIEQEQYLNQELYQELQQEQNQESLQQNQNIQQNQQDQNIQEIEQNQNLQDIQENKDQVIELQPQSQNQNIQNYDLQNHQQQPQSSQQIQNLQVHIQNLE